jgi:predicted HTH transcriptional regulator
MAGASEQDLRQLIKQPEGLDLEFKTSVPESDRLARQLAAFANTDGGTLVIGVREPGEVVGINNVERVRHVFESAVRELTPPPEASLDVAILDGKKIAVIRVGRSPGPVFDKKNGVFVRVGEQNRPMTAADLAQRFQQAPVPPDLAALAENIASLTQQIEALTEQLQLANNWKGKLKDYFIGGIIGAVLGALVGLVIK